MGKEQETRSRTELPDFINRAGKNLVNRAEAFAAKPYEAYQGQRVANFSGDQENMFQQLRDYVSGRPDVLGESLQGARDYATAPAQKIDTQRLIDEGGRLGNISDYLNPYAEGTLDPALEKIHEQIAKQRKQVNAMATQAGAFGDARHGILEGEVFGNGQDVLADTISKFYNDAFDKAMGLRAADEGRMLNVDSQNAQLNENALSRLFAGSGSLIDRTGADQSNVLQSLQSLLNSGTIQQGQEQAKLDNQYNDFLREYQHEFDIMNMMRSALGVPTEQTRIDTKPDNSLAQIAGAALGSAVRGGL